jgi:hypothetical protein
VVSCEAFGRHDSRRQKLLSKYWGPFRILEAIGRNAVHLNLPQHVHHMHPDVSLTLIKPYVPRSGQPPPVTISGEEEYALDVVTDFNLLCQTLLKCV